MKSDEIVKAPKFYKRSMARNVNWNNMIISNRDFEKSEGGRKQLQAVIRMINCNCTRIN